MVAVQDCITKNSKALNIHPEKNYNNVCRRGFLTCKSFMHTFTSE
jgi:hypothetical protein